MLIQRKPTAVKSITIRTDEQMDSAVKTLAGQIGTNPSTIARLAIANLIAQSKRIHPTTLQELFYETN